MSDLDARGEFERSGRWPTLLARMLDLAVLPGDRPDLVRTKRLFTATMWASLVTTAVSVYQLYAIGARWPALAVSFPFVTAVVALVAMAARPFTYPAVMHVVAAGTLATSGVMVIVLGGVWEAAGATSWGVLVVVGAAAVFGDRRAHFWVVAFVVVVIGSALVAREVGPFDVLPNREYTATFNIVVVGVFVYAALYYFVRQSDRLYRQSEELIRNILPDAVVERLKTSDQMIADRYESASILFADIAGFTTMSAEMDPGDVIGILNEVFVAFDGMVTARGLEKIKTIGDAYMVAAGVPRESDDHAIEICHLALEMLGYLDARAPSQHPLEMRIGVATGPLMAGIIGRRKFSYDLWGDTVNLASRMESTGTPGRIQVDRATRTAASERFDFEERGMVEVKGRGPTTTWYLLGPREG